MAERVVWKFPVLSTGPMDIQIPARGEIVHVGRDPATGLLAIWALVDPEAPKRWRRFQVIGTGAAVPQGATHRGTVIMGEFVWHLFEGGL